MKSSSLLLSLVLLFPQVVLANTLVGNISNQYGRIGVQCTKGGYVSKVYIHSWAGWVGIHKKDIILSADGVKGIKCVDGIAYTYGDLVVQRGEQILNFHVFRLPPSLIYDEKEDENVPEY